MGADNGGEGARIEWVAIESVGRDGGTAERKAVVASAGPWKKSSGSSAASPGRWAGSSTGSMRAE